MPSPSLILKGGKLLVIGGTALAIDKRCCCGPPKCSICDVDTVTVTLAGITVCDSSCTGDCKFYKVTGSPNGTYTLTRTAPGSCLWTGTFGGMTVERYTDSFCSTGTLTETGTELTITAQRQAGWSVQASVNVAFGEIFSGSAANPCCDDTEVANDIAAIGIISRGDGTATVSTGITDPCPCDTCCDPLYVTIPGGAGFTADPVRISRSEGCNWFGLGLTDTGESIIVNLRRVGGAFVCDIQITHPDCAGGLCCRSKFTAVVPGSGCPEDATWVNVPTDPTCGTVGFAVSCSAAPCETDCSACTVLANALSITQSGVGVSGWDDTMQVDVPGVCPMLASNGQLDATLECPDTAAGIWRLIIYTDSAGPTGEHITYEEPAEADGCPPAVFTHVTENTVPGSGSSPVATIDT